MLDDDDEPFVYEDDVDSPTQSDIEASASPDEQVDELADDAMDQDASPAPALASSNAPNDSDLEIDAPPEHQPPKSKGKMTSRKQYQLDVDALIERFGVVTDENVTSALPLRVPFLPLR
jgi:hypothetical protein